MSMEDRPFDPPVPAGRCTNCGKPLVATHREYEPYVLNGCRSYRFAHADGTTQCVIVRQPKPYDNWDATRLVEAEVRRRWDEEDEALEAAEGGR